MPKLVVDRSERLLEACVMRNTGIILLKKDQNLCCAEWCSMHLTRIFVYFIHYSTAVVECGFSTKTAGGSEFLSVFLLPYVY